MKEEMCRYSKEVASRHCNVMNIFLEMERKGSEFESKDSRAISLLSISGKYMEKIEATGYKKKQSKSRVYQKQNVEIKFLPCLKL